MKKQLSIFIFLIFSCCGFANADIVTWSVGSDFISATGHQNISTNGTLVRAVNFGGNTGPLTVNTGTEMITFTDDTTTFPNGQFNVGFTSPDAGWQGVINQADFSGANPITFPIAGLNAGSTYQIEFFVLDDRNAGIGARTFEFTDGFGNSSTTMTQADGVSTIGTFTPTGSSLNFSLSQSATDPTINGYVLREITAVPEPTAVGLLGLVTIGLFSRRRR